jgi:hypothetical protein
MFPGLRLDTAALTRDDLDTLMDVLQHGVDPKNTRNSSPG